MSNILLKMKQLICVKKPKPNQDCLIGNRRDRKILIPSNSAPSSFFFTVSIYFCFVTIRLRTIVLGGKSNRVFSKFSSYLQKHPQLPPDTSLAHFELTIY